MNYVHSIFLKNNDDLDKIDNVIKKIERQIKISKVEIRDFDLIEIKSSLIKYSRIIQKERLDGFLNIISPEGSEGRSFDEEIDFYKESKKNGFIYKVTFTYPHVKEAFELGYKNKIDRKLKSIKEIEENLRYEKNTNVKNIIKDIVFTSKERINLLMTLKELSDLQEENCNHYKKLQEDKFLKKIKLEDKCFCHLKNIYGDVDDVLVKRANTINQENVLKISKGKNDSDIEKKITSNNFNAEEIVNEFNIFFKKTNMKNCLAVIDERQKNCATVINSNYYKGKTVVKVPARYNINGLRLLQLLYHELWHVITGEYQSQELGLSSIKFGRNADAVKEGVAVLAEKGAVNNILGYEKIKNKAFPYYVMAIEKIKNMSNDGENKINPGEIYDFIFDISRECFADRGYNEEMIERKVRNIIGRIFRGVPGERHYNAKDVMYLKGEYMAEELKKANLLSFVEELYVSPELIPFFIKTGIYESKNSEKVINEYRKAIDNIIEDNDWKKRFLK